jgi:hypothetical protein
MTLIVKPGFNGMTDADAIAYVNAVEAADGQLLEFGVGKAINDFVVGCKLDGTWSAIKASCILAGARTRLGALTPLVGTAPQSFNFVDENYDRKTGLVGDGSTQYLDSNRNNNADPQNSNHLSVYASTQMTSTSTTFPFYIGAGRTTSGAKHIGRLSNDGNLFTRNCSSVFDSSSASVSGFLAINRSTSSTYNTRFASTNKIIAQTSQTPLNANISVFWSGTDASERSNARLAFYSIGESLDLALLDTRVTALITAFGVAIP